MTAQKNRGRRIVVAAVALAALSLGVTSCGAINQQSTALQYSASDGLVVNVGELDVRNLLFVEADKTSEARVLGSLVNATDKPLNMSMKVNGTSLKFTVPANSSKEFEKDANKTLIPSTGVIAGAQVPTTLTVGDVSTEVQVPVVDGTLVEYRPYVPGGHDSSVTQHLTPSPKSESGH
ncbi:hypothetical protein [Paeniglutamicibacter cryotolerans]|uniref:DNA modification methylase n=1 Tax=Paeniglutamicibacter cryotolerans TaxID=670079 RepID=A0A839QQ34_9MICC|nr:hypothetical protein [Paeniglutamicibacter cryotolerans]MBB2995362.1 hypothetical protein [Paeniglutamicibacter cryotolerans]